MKRIRRRDGSIIAVGDSYVMQDGEAIAFDAMFMDGMDGIHVLMCLSSAGCSG
jgi:hypothetical protein